MNKLVLVLTVSIIMGCGSGGALWDPCDCSTDCGVRVDTRVTETTPERAIPTLTASLASDTPPGMTLRRNSTQVSLLKFNLGMTGGEATIIGLRFHRVGIGALDDFSAIHLYDSSARRLSTRLVLDPATGSVDFTDLDQLIRADQTRAYNLVVDLTIPTGDVGGQHAFELTSVTAITQRGAEAVRGSFPIRGNIFTIGSACELVPGALIKATGPAVYVIGRNRQRFIFPNDRTYFTWYPDFAGVCTLTDMELAAIQIGGNVTMRPGTWLIKITSDPKVYAITHCGVRHWVYDEASALTLYGPRWNERVVDVPDGFFINYIAGDHTYSPFHPQGTLISYASDPRTIYLVDEYHQRRRFASDYAFSVNRYRREFVIVTERVYIDGPPITGYEEVLSETVCIN